MRISKLLFTCLTFITILSCTDNSNAANNYITTNIQKEVHKVSYTLKKYTQNCCTKMVEYNLKEVEGYIKSESNIEKQAITVWFDTDKCTEADIKFAINRSGYSIIETEK